MPEPPVPPDVDEFLRQPNQAVIATIRRDGSPHCVPTWYDWEDGRALVIMADTRLRLRHMRRDPRVALSMEGAEVGDNGLKDYLVVYGTARVTEGGAPELLQRLARVYIGPDVKFPPMDDPPPGVRLVISVERIGGVGPWRS